MATKMREAAGIPKVGPQCDPQTKRRTTDEIRRARNGMPKVAFKADPVAAFRRSNTGFRSGRSG